MVMIFGFLPFLGWSLLAVSCLLQALEATVFFPADKY
jgi:hypothetical protein